MNPNLFTPAAFGQNLHSPTIPANQFGPSQIRINENITKQMFVALSTELLNLTNVSKLRTGDRVNFPHKSGVDRPTGYWVSPTIHTDSFTWSCDIWLQKPSWVNTKIYRYDNTLTHLNDEQRISILTIKKELIEAGRYGVGKDFESVDIYDAVLKNQNLSLEELRKLFSTSIELV